MNWKRKLGKFLFTAFLGAILWTLLLTPYMILLMGLNPEQYISWILMQFTLVPFIAPVVFLITEYALKKVGLK